MKSKTKMLVFTLPPWHCWYWFIFLCKIKINFLLLFVQFVISLLCLDVFFFFNHSQVVFKCSKCTPHILQMLWNEKRSRCSFVPKKENIDCYHHSSLSFTRVCACRSLPRVVEWKGWHLKPYGSQRLILFNRHQKHMLASVPLLAEHPLCTMRKHHLLCSQRLG